MANISNTIVLNLNYYCVFVSLANSFNKIIYVWHLHNTPYIHIVHRWGGQPVASSTASTALRQWAWGAFVHRCNNELCFNCVGDEMDGRFMRGDVQKGDDPQKPVCVSSLCVRKLNWWGNYGWFHVYLSIKILMYVARGRRKWDRAPTGYVEGLALAAWAWAVDGAPVLYFGGF